MFESIFCGVCALLCLLSSLVLGRHSRAMDEHGKVLREYMALQHPAPPKESKHAGGAK